MGKQAEVLRGCPRDPDASLLCSLCLAQNPACSRCVINICWMNRVRGCLESRRGMQGGWWAWGTQTESYKLHLRGKKNRERLLGKRCRISELWIRREGQGKAVPA